MIDEWLDKHHALFVREKYDAAETEIRKLVWLEYAERFLPELAEQLKRRDSK